MSAVSKSPVKTPWYALVYFPFRLNAYHGVSYIKGGKQIQNLLTNNPS